MASENRRIRAQPCTRGHEGETRERGLLKERDFNGNGTAHRMPHEDDVRKSRLDQNRANDAGDGADRVRGRPGRPAVPRQIDGHEVRAPGRGQMASHIPPNPGAAPRPMNRKIGGAVRAHLSVHREENGRAVGNEGASLGCDALDRAAAHFCCSVGVSQGAVVFPGEVPWKLRTV